MSIHGGRFPFSGFVRHPASRFPHSVPPCHGLMIPFHVSSRLPNVADSWCPAQCLVHVALYRIHSVPGLPGPHAPPVGTRSCRIHNSSSLVTCVSCFVPQGSNSELWTSQPWRWGIAECSVNSNMRSVSSALLCSRCFAHALRVLQVHSDVVGGRGRFLEEKRVVTECRLSRMT